MRDGGDSLNYLKSGWSKNEGRGNKDFKKSGQVGSKVGCLKKEGDWNSLIRALS